MKKIGPRDRLKESMLHLLQSTNASALRRRTFCSAKEQLAKEAAQAEKERFARELVYGAGGKPSPFPWGQVIFTAFILGSYVAYVKMIEEPLDRNWGEITGKPDVATVELGPLPPGASCRLPDGRVLMADGSISRP